MVRDEDRDTMFLGTILRFQQMVFVRRSSKTKQEALTTFSSRTEEKDWGQLVFFPEGTTSVGSSLLPFKQGAFLPGTHLIHPVILRYLTGWIVQPGPLGMVGSWALPWW